jgi:U3 small nucleolar RNA-associated protein 21
VFPVDDGAGDKRGSKLVGSVKRTMKVLEGGEITSGNQLKNDEQGKRMAAAAEAKRSRMAELAHTAAVIGSYASTTNQYAATVDTSGKVNKWSFATHAPTANSPFNLGTPLTGSLHLRASELLVVSTSFFNVSVVDLKALVTVRTLRGHSGTITSLDATPDARRVFSASLDKTLRVWDVPTGQCVDW